MKIKNQEFSAADETDAMQSETFRSTEGRLEIRLELLYKR
jgi:hypothetical protein